jgi:hypothetical protein
MTNTNYAIVDGFGDELATGLQVHTARRIAQEMADSRGEEVYLYEIPVSEDGEQEQETIAPSSIDIEMDTPNGPRVEYGGHEAEAVERAIPEGYKVDWPNSVEISISGTHTLRYRAPLVTDGLVVLETMPDHLRGSHRAARNWGTYPSNGAVRTRVTRDEAEEIVLADHDGYARIVEA